MESKLDKLMFDVNEFLLKEYDCVFTVEALESVFHIITKSTGAGGESKAVFPFGVNSEMDCHAESHGFSHWSCVSPKSNDWWVRKDGRKLVAKFHYGRGYLDDLQEFDAAQPMRK